MCAWFCVIWLLVSRWGLVCSGGVEHPPGKVLIATMNVSQSYKMSGTHKVELEHWWPALMVHDRSCDCCQVRRLLRPAAVAYGQAGVGMICTLTPVLFQCSRSHWRMIKYSAGWGLGACRLFTRGFFFPSPSLPLLSHPQCLCILACTNVIATTKEAHLCRGMSQIGLQFRRQSIKSKRHSICTRWESFACRFHRLCSCLS